MSTTAVSTLNVTDPGSLIEAVPYLLGFHPSPESLVLVGLALDAVTGRSRVQVVMRVDLPDGPLRGADLARLFDTLTFAAVTEVIGVIFTATHMGGDPRVARAWTDLQAAVELQTIGAAMTLVEMLLATDDRWWSLVCADPNCCAPEGSAREVGCSVVAAKAVVAGLAARSSRDDLASILDPRAGSVVPLADLASAEDRITRAILSDQLKRTRIADTRAIVAAINRGHKGEPNAMTSAQTARFATALTDIGIRDELWLQIDERSVQAGEFMLAMLRRLPAPYDAPPLFLFGWDQWRAGNGIVAAMAAERAMDSDPGYSAANLLLSAVRCGLDPRTTPVLRDPVSTS